VPLRLNLRPHEKLFLNGAVIVNGESRTEFTVLNDAAILREKDIMTEEAANTVCKRIYFLIQLMYIDPPSLRGYRNALDAVLDETGKAVPDLAPFLDRIRDLVSNGSYYQAMKVARKLISIEKETLENAGKPD